MYIKKSISLPLPRHAFIPPPSLHLMRNSKTKQRSASTVAKSQERVRNCKVNVDGCGTATRKHDSLCLLDITDTRMCPTHSNIPFPSSRSPYRPSIWSLRDRFGKSFIIGLVITVKRYANPKKNTPDSVHDVKSCKRSSRLEFVMLGSNMDVNGIFEKQRLLQTAVLPYFILVFFWKCFELKKIKYFEVYEKV